MVSAPVHPSRRTVTKGVGWAVPTIALGAAAPAFAASPCSCTPNGCPSMGFGGALDGNGWKLSTVGTFTGGTTRYSGTYAPSTGGNASCNSVTGGTGGGSISGAIVMEGDPTAAGASITYSKSVCLQAGRTYTFAWSWNSFNANNRSMFLDAQVVSCSGTVVATAAQVQALGRTTNNRGSRMLTVTPTATSLYTFEFIGTFGTTPAYDSACNRYANDIGFTAPLCSGG